MPLKKSAGKPAKKPVLRAGKAEKPKLRDSSAKSPSGKIAGSVKKIQVAQTQSVEMGKSGPVERRAGSAEQMKAFDRAMSLFHDRDFKEAHRVLAQVLDGPNRQMAHVAHLHIRMCEQRLAVQAPQPRTPEEHYTLAVTMLNRRQDLPQAEQHLRTALDLQPNADHFHYALALCFGLQGNYRGAGASLSRAIELRSSNRFAARNDPDFREFSQISPVRELLTADQA